VVLSGGDPAKREDLFDLIKYGSQLGLRMDTLAVLSKTASIS
jgi:MoaA/NifB/PqqE/SkfB family radical SAM enzyme